MKMIMGVLLLADNLLSIVAIVVTSSVLIKHEINNYDPLFTGCGLVLFKNVSLMH